MSAFKSVAVIGAGAWGTALATVAARAGRTVTLWARNAEHAARISSTRDNPRLPGVRIAPEIIVTSDLAEASRAKMLLIATPAQHLRGAVNMLASHLTRPTPIVACAKGIEHGTHKFMTDVIAEAAPGAHPAILSGPSFADDVARGLPTAVTLAAKDEALASSLVQALGSPTFRPYHSTDIRGVEIGGAAKNVLAIAVGIAVGRKLGASAQAALTTRGFAESHASRSRARRAQRDARRPVRSRRSHSDLREPAITQLRAWPCTRPRRAAARRQACRGRVHRARADRVSQLRKTSRCRYLKRSPRS